jgi:hypothetical protein
MRSVVAGHLQFLFVEASFGGQVWLVCCVRLPDRVDTARTGPPAPEVVLPAFAAWPVALRRPAPPGEPITIVAEAASTCVGLVMVSHMSSQSGCGQRRSPSPTSRVS